MAVERTPSSGAARPDAPSRSGTCVASRSWRSSEAVDVAVHVSTFDRAPFLSTLVERLEAQTLARDRFEVVIVDNGSSDGTWDVLRDIVARSPLRIAARRLDLNGGPAGGRNAAVRLSSAPLLAFTDDDCLPQPGWLEALVTSADSADVVQGRTEPEPPGEGTGAWDRTISIAGETALFETCNIAYRRSAFDAAGGFDEAAAVSARPGGRAFGEDVLLGSAVVAAGGRRAFAADAVVHHRYLPGTYAQHVREMRNLAGFPALAATSATVAGALWHRWFLTSRTAAFDLALAGGLAAVALRRPVLLLATLPWVVEALPATREHGGRHPVVRLAQLAAADAVGAASLVEGSIRHRRFVL